VWRSAAALVAVSAAWSCSSAQRCFGSQCLGATGGGAAGQSESAGGSVNTEAGGSAGNVSQPQGMSGETATAGEPATAEAGAAGAAPAAHELTTLDLLVGTLGGAGRADGQGAEARFTFPNTVASDGNGQVFIADGPAIRKLELATGKVTTFAGSLSERDHVDGVGAAARFTGPTGLAVDGGYLFVSEQCALRRVDLTTAKVTTFAGAVDSCETLDGTGTAAHFGVASQLTGDGQGSLVVIDGTVLRLVTTAGVVKTLTPKTEVLFADIAMGPPRGGHPSIFVAQLANVSAIDLVSGAVTVLAGGGAAYADGTGVEVGMSSARALSWDGANRLYIGDGVGLRAMDVDTTKVSTIAGSLTEAGVASGAGATARFSGINSLAFTKSPSAVYIADGTRIRKLDTGFSNVVAVAGTAVTIGSADGIGQDALFKNPSGLASSGNDTLYVADAGNETIRKVDIAKAEVTTLAGSPGLRGSDDGIGGAARFDFLVAGAYPASGIVLDGQGNLFVPDPWNFTLRKIKLSTRLVSLFSGAAKMIGSTDGTAELARYWFPISACVRDGQMYVTDGLGGSVRKVDLASGAAATFAGAPGKQGSVDARGTEARFTFGPQLPGLATDDDGNLYLSDSRNHTIRKLVLATADVTALAGKSGTPGSDDGVGDAARFNTPTGLAFDGRGHLLVADSANSTIRRIDLATKEVTTLVGVPGMAKVDPGPLPGGLNRPEGLTVLANGDVVVSDFNENALLVIH
jgi:sugar lactone lactonase YvrE